jgi:class 3 adenylate cyclase/tetratricopeptide (TPR) repeat protein
VFGKPTGVAVENDVTGTAGRWGEAQANAVVERANRAILLVDVVESVRLVETDEVGFISRWLALVDHVQRHVVPSCNGHFVKSLGDGMLLDFDEVRSAVSAAFAIQHANARANVGLPPEQQVLLRMGLEVSDVIVGSNDLHGRGVNRAARLMTIAGPNEIVVSKDARDRLTPSLDADVEDLGDCFVRHAAEPIRAFRVGPPGPRPVVTASYFHEELAPTIVVVPFAPRPAGDDGAVGEVLAEEVIRILSHSPDLNVISRLSTTAFRGRDITLAEISAHLSADYVLSGTYGTEGRRLSLNAELAEAKSGRILWTDRLTGDLQGVLSEGDDLIEALVAAIELAVVAREIDRSRSQPLPTVKAYTLLIGAITLMHRLSLRDFEEARHLLHALLDRGTRQPVPQAWLANWHVLRVQQGWSVDPREDTYQALECTKRALDTDPECSLALAVDGFVYTNLLRRLDVAQERYDLAIAANPNNPFAWCLRGALHAFKGEGEEAVANSRHALKLTPLDPHRYFYDSLAGSAYIAAEQYDAALESAERSLRANRKHTSTLRVMAVAQWRLGLHDQARQTAQELLRLDPTLTVSRWLERAPSAPFRVGQDFADTLRHVGVPG